MLISLVYFNMQIYDYLRNDYRFNYMNEWLKKGAIIMKKTMLVSPTETPNFWYHV